jgi:hypothetical protein
MVEWTAGIRDAFRGGRSPRRIKRVTRRPLRRAAADNLTPWNNMNWRSISREKRKLRKSRLGSESETSSQQSRLAKLRHTELRCDKTLDAPRTIFMIS